MADQNRSLSWKSVIVGIAVGTLLVASAPVIADVGDAVLQGRVNTVNQRTTIRGESAGSTLRLINSRAGAAGLSVVVEPGSPPLRVTSKKKVENLNADLLDGRNAAYFATSKPRPGQTIVGAFGAAGDGTFLVHAATFTTPLEASIPQSNVHYVLPEAGPTTDCPGVFQAVAGHLCIYATWENSVAFNGIGRINNDFLNNGASRYGFTILWTGQSSSANVRGNWAYTVPQRPADVIPEEVPSPGAYTEAGLLPQP